jgi:hypothetical protein
MIKIITSITLILIASLTIFCQKPLFKKNDKNWKELISENQFLEWKAAENKENWMAGDSMFISKGKRSHLFYQGPELKDGFKNFEIEVEVKTHKLANSGIYFHTEYQEIGWPSKGIEIQVNNTHVGEGEYIELKKMGSLYGYRNIYKKLFDDYKWNKITARVSSNRVEIWYNDIKTVDYVQPLNAKGRKLSSGTFALQGHDPLSKIEYRSFKVRRLNDNFSQIVSENQPVWMDSIVKYQNQQIAFIDLRPQSDLSVQAMININYETGINFGRIIKNPVTATTPVIYYKGKIITNQQKPDPNSDYTIGIGESKNKMVSLIQSETINIWSDTNKIITSDNRKELLGMMNHYSVALEIDNVKQWPDINTITLAKSKGIKFTFSGLIGNMTEDAYIFKAIREAKIEYKDLYIPD